MDEKRREAIMDLRDNKGVKLEDLQENDGFIDTVIQATHITYGNSQDEKLEALKNAIVHSGLPNPPEQSVQQVFLNWLDVFTVWHLRLLKLYQSLEKWEKENNRRIERLAAGGLDHIFESAYPEMKGQRGFYDLVWSDLFQNGLVTNDSLPGLMSGRGLYEKRTTDFGDSFHSS